MFAQKMAHGILLVDQETKPTINFNNVFEGAKGLVSDISNSVGDIKQRLIMK